MSTRTTWRACFTSRALLQARGLWLEQMNDQNLPYSLVINRKHLENLFGWLRNIYWAALSLSFRQISNVNEHNSLGSPGNVICEWPLSTKIEMRAKKLTFWPRFWIFTRSNPEIIAQFYCQYVLYHVAIPTDVSLLSLAGGKAARRVCNVWQSMCGRVQAIFMPILPTY